MTRKWDASLGQWRESGKFDGNDGATAAGGMMALSTPAGFDVQDAIEQMVTLRVRGLEGQAGFTNEARQEIERNISAMEIRGVPEEYTAEYLLHQERVRSEAVGSDYNMRYYETLGYGAGQDNLLLAYENGMPPNWPSEIAAHDPRLANYVARSWNAGLDREEFYRLRDAGLGDFGVASAYIGADTQVVQGWLHEKYANPEFGTYVDKYLGHQGTGIYVREGVPLEHVIAAHEAGVAPENARFGITRPDGSVERGKAAILELAEYARVSGQSTDEARIGIEMGISAKKLKSYGANILVTEIPEFEETGVDPRVVKSLRARDRNMPAEDMAYLAQHNITTGAQYKAWRDVITTRYSTPETTGVRSTDFNHVLTFAQASIPIGDVKRLREQKAPLETVLELHRAGISDMTQWAYEITPRTQGHLNDTGKTNAVYRGLAKFAKTGGTPEQLGRTQRAGIPLKDAHKYVNASPQQIWDAGKTGRDAAMAEEQRLYDTWGPSYARAPEPWEATGPQDL